MKRLLTTAIFFLLLSTLSIGQDLVYFAKGEQLLADGQQVTQADLQSILLEMQQELETVK